MVTTSSGLLLKFTPGKVWPIFHFWGTMGCIEPLYLYLLWSQGNNLIWREGSSIWELCRRNAIIFYFPMKHSYIISSSPKQESHFQGLIFSLVLLSRDLLCSSVLAHRQSIFSYRACLLTLVVQWRSDERSSFWWENLTPPCQDLAWEGLGKWDLGWGGCNRFEVLWELPGDRVVLEKAEELQLGLT